MERPSNKFWNEVNKEKNSFGESIDKIDNKYKSGRDRSEGRKKWHHQRERAPEHKKEEISSLQGGAPQQGEEARSKNETNSKKKPEPKEEIAPSGNMNTPRPLELGGDQESKGKRILDIKTASETARKKMEEILAKKAYSIASISREGDVWNARVEMIDEEYLPGQNLASMNDIIGVYDVKLDSQGELISYDKKSSRQRGNTN